MEKSMPNDTWVVILAIGGMIISPFVSILGIILSEKRQIKRDKAIAENEEAEAKTKDEEVQVLMNKASGDALILYGSVISSLRTQVDKMMVDITTHTNEIGTLVLKLNLVTAEKERLALENIQLLARIKAQDDKIKVQDEKIKEQSGEIIELRQKINLLEDIAKE